MAATLDVVADALGADRAAALPDGRRRAARLLRRGGARRSTCSTACCRPGSARNGQVWTRGGKLNLRNARFLDDPGPIDPECACEACRNHSRAYLAHLFRAQELLAYRLSSVHNVTYTLDLMEQIRGALAEGRSHRCGRSSRRSFQAPARVDKQSLRGR